MFDYADDDYIYVNHRELKFWRDALEEELTWNLCTGVCIDDDMNFNSCVNNVHKMPENKLALCNASLAC